MQNMSFKLTTEQVRAQTKTVTRRLGGWRIKVGDLRQPVVQNQGLKKGERITRINGPIRFTDVRRERLDAITPEDVIREGFPGMTPAAFVAMFTGHNHCRPDAEVARLAFEYLEPR